MEKFDSFRMAVEKRVAAFDPAADGPDAESEFDSTETVSFKELVMRYADGSDIILCICGTIFSTIFGAGMPALCIIFGDLADDMGSSAGNYDVMKSTASTMILIGVVMWIFAWAQITTWSTFAMRIAHKIRIVYFRKCLEKDAAFYDVNNPTEMSAKISKEISAI